MEIVDSKHPDISRKVRGGEFVTIAKKKFIYFSAAASKEYGIIAGKKITFIIEEGLLLFYVNKDGDGFLINGATGNKATFISNTSLVALIKKRMSGYLEIVDGSSFLLRKTKQINCGNNLSEILITKPLRKPGK